MKYVLIDTLNLFFRIRHIAPRQTDINDKVGLSIHMMFAATNKLAKTAGVDHVVFALEGNDNWRKKFYEPYKKPRAEDRQKRTEQEILEDDLYFEVFNDFINYLNEKTNCSVVSIPTAEADDVIARWIHLHPNDEHIILSSDTDYYQLISENVQQYNGVTKELITLDGFFDDNNNKVIDKKTNEHKKIGDPKWVLFEKCIRGDKSDNIFSAYPGVRTKGTKKKTGLLEAYADMDKKGFNWHNLMLHRWIDHNGIEHKVIDDYERNKKLIDLSAQPTEVLDKVDRGIFETSKTKNILPRDINFSFMKFCSRYDLVRLSEHPNDVVGWMIKPYDGDMKEYSEFNEWIKSKQSQ